MELNTLKYEDLKALIKELENDDAELTKDITKLTSAIEKEEDLDFVDNSEDETGDVSDVILGLEAIDSVAINKRLKERASRERLAKYRVRIQRLAINQNLLPLSNLIPNYDLQALTTVLTEKQINIANKAAESANKRLKRLLNSLIPVNIRRMYIMYPWVMKRCPGFIYNCDYIQEAVMSNKRGFGGNCAQTIYFWATPDIPYFFRQGTEVTILANYRQDFIYLVDKAVSLHIKYQGLQEARALNIASRLIKNRVQTYFDLLMYNPRWFEILYNLINDEKNSSTLSGTV